LNGSTTLGLFGSSATEGAAKPMLRVAIKPIDAADILGLKFFISKYLS
jgi:hypothetical protein